MSYVESTKDYISAELASMIKYLREFQVNGKLISELTAAGLIGFGVIYFGKIWYSYGFFKNRGIKTPPYKFFFGNTLEIMENGYAETLSEWTAKYGKTYGFYEGHYPIMVTSDLDLIEEIFYKQFANFSARKRLMMQASDDSPNVNVFTASRNRWKRLRTISNQAFSPLKLKELLSTMQMSSDRLINEISKSANKEIDISELIAQMTMDVVWNCTFGIDIDLISNPNFVYFVKIRELLNGFANYNMLCKTILYFYEMKPIIITWTMLSSLLLSKLSPRLGNPFFWIIRRVHEVIDERIEDNKINKAKKHDMVQLLIDAEADKVNLDFDNQHYESGNTKLIEKKMTRSEILSSLMGLMAGGFDTTAATLNFCIYMLLAHPEEKARVQEEIDSMEDYDYETLNKLEYLDMFIKEVLRMFPPAISVQNRRCTKATTLKGIDIPEDILIAVNVLSLHYDPEYWPGVDPNFFYPLRFAPDAKYNKLAYMPFGAGARICLGMRFAYLEIKLTLAKLLKNFEISSVRSLPKKPKTTSGIVAVMKIQEPIRVIFKPK